MVDIKDIYNIKINFSVLISLIFDFIEKLVRIVVIYLTNLLPVKVIRDDKGVPFLTCSSHRLP